MYFLFLLAVIFFGGAFVKNFRGVFSPELIIFLVITYQFPLDYLVRGDDYQTNESGILVGDGLMIYKVIIFIFYSLACSLLVLSKRSYLRNTFGNDWKMTTFSSWRYLIPLLLILADVFKRLSFSGYSVLNAIENTFGPRGGAPWAYAEGNLGDERFALNMISQFLPVAVGFVVPAWNLGVTHKILILSIFAYTLAVLVGDGSRIPVVICVGVVIAYFLINQKINGKSLSLPIIGGLILVGTLVSIQYNFRAEGLAQAWREDSLRSGEDFSIYHQDDNFYQTLEAMYYADTTDVRWDATQFFYTLAVNPIPRVIWPGKPALTANFWGIYKTESTTLSFLGESVALFGVSGGVVFAIGYLYLLRTLLAYFFKRIKDFDTLLIYMLAGAYLYYCTRSILYVTQGLYILLFAIVLVGTSSCFRISKRAA